MIGLDRALSIYTDKLIAGEDINLNYFCENLRQEDIEEFRELAKIINVTMSLSYTKKFEKTFEQINNYKEQIYSLSKAADFRKDHSILNEDDEIQKTLDVLFDEEFPDE